MSRNTCADLGGGTAGPAPPPFGDSKNKKGKEEGKEKRKIDTIRQKENGKSRKYEKRQNYCI